MKDLCEKSSKAGHKRQASNIHQWKPWLKAGVKTKEGKAIVSQNAWKHGLRSREYTQYIQTSDVRSRIIMSEKDSTLAFMWMLELMSEMEAFKPSCAGNLKTIAQQSAERTEDTLEDSVKMEYAHQAREWHEAVARAKTQPVKKGTSV